MSKPKKCEQCGEPHDLNGEHAVSTNKYNGERWIKLNFCCEGCANVFYLDSLRNAGT